MPSVRICGARGASALAQAASIAYPTNWRIQSGSSSPRRRERELHVDELGPDNEVGVGPSDERREPAKRRVQVHAARMRQLWDRRDLHHPKHLERVAAISDWQWRHVGSPGPVEDVELGEKNGTSSDGEAAPRSPALDVCFDVRLRLAEDLGVPGTESRCMLSDPVGPLHCVAIVAFDFESQCVVDRGSDRGLALR